MSKERWQFLRPQREEGMALVLAVVTTTLIMIMVVAMLSFTSASSRDANLNDARQTAHALGEAGVNHALAQLASHYYEEWGSPPQPNPYREDGKTPVNASTAPDSSWLSGSQISPDDSSVCTSTSTCVTWSGSYTPAPQGVRQGIITITGAGTVPNPTGAARVVQRLTTKVDVLKVPQQVKTPDYWKEIYVGHDFILQQGVEVTAPLYVGGNLTLQNSSKIYGSNVTLKVLGWAYVQSNQATIGSKNGSPARIARAQIKGGCASWKDSQPTPTSGCTINQSGSNWQIYDNYNSGSAYDAHLPANLPTADPLPTIKWSEAQSNQELSSPPPTCNDSHSLTSTLTPFDLTPSAPYHCDTAVGSINWNPATRVLTVKGSIWFPGDLKIDTSNTPTTYTGIGSFYVQGRITIANNSYLCVKLAGAECDFANAKNSGSAGYWDATQNLLILQAQHDVIGTNFHFQGGIYSDTLISIGGGGGGTAGTQGPLISPGTITVGQQMHGGFPDFPEITSGSLGTETPLTLGPPYSGTF